MMMKKLQVDTPIKSLSLSISQLYKPHKTHKSVLPISHFEKLIITRTMVPKRVPFYSYKEILAKIGKKS